MTQWGVDTLFNPAKRHMDEEKRRLQSTREEIGDSSGGKRIDFESGKVTITRHRNVDADGHPDEADQPDDADRPDEANLSEQVHPPDESAAAGQSDGAGAQQGTASSDS